MAWQNDNWNGDKIKSLRQRLGWSPSELARRLKCESTIISDWESGTQEPNMTSLQELDILLKQADSTADEMAVHVLAEIYLEESELVQVGSDQVKRKFVDN